MSLLWHRQGNTQRNGELEMSLEENKAIARRLVEEGWANPDILDEIMADDMVGPGDIRGLDAYRQACVAFFEGFPDAQCSVDDIIAEGDKVVVRWKVTATHTGEWAGIPATNKQVSYGGTDTMRIADGKVAQGWQHWNGFWLHVQLGTIPSWEEIVKQAQTKHA
jgi:predicted ester cyclase